MDRINEQTIPTTLNLTCSSDKLAYYEEDPYFYESWLDIQEILSREMLQEFLMHCGSIIIKPEAIISGKAFDIVDFYTTRHFKPVMFRVLELDRHAVRALWRYQLNGATRERLVLLDEWSALSKMVYVILKDENPNSEIPSATRITKLRGHSNPKRHNPGELRMQLGQEITMLNYLHSADEPADMIRDLGVLFSGQERRSVLDEVGKDEDCSNRLQEELRNLSGTTMCTGITFDDIVTALSERTKQTSFAKKIDKLVNNPESEVQEIEMLINEYGTSLTKLEKIVLRARFCKLVRSSTALKIKSILSHNL